MQTRRNWLPVLGWLAATSTSVVLASVAMLPVFRTATPNESALVSLDQLRDTGSPAPASLPAVPPGPVPSAAPTSAAPGTVTPTPAAPTRTRTTAPPERTIDPARPPAPTTTAPVETTVEDGWTVTTGGDGLRTYTRSFRVEGGTTVIRMVADKVTLITATPSDGFSVATVQNEPDNLAVYFNQPGRSFIIHAVWHNDRPFAEVSQVGA